MIQHGGCGRRTGCKSFAGPGKRCAAPVAVLVAATAERIVLEHILSLAMTTMEKKKDGKPQPGNLPHHPGEQGGEVTRPRDLRSLFFQMFVREQA